MQTLTLTWQGTRYDFKPSFELFMRIEESVMFSRIAQGVTRASEGMVVELPMSHVAWVLYCCLRHAGAPVRTPLEVHHAIFDAADTLDHQGVLGGLIVAYYAAQPEKPPKKKEEEAGPSMSRSRPSSRRSKSATA